MTDERADELGIPRRKFLKSAAVVAFAAPAVVSFGLDGVAEGAPRGPQPCQFEPNQALGAGLHVVQQHLLPAINVVLQYRWHSSRVPPFIPPSVQVQAAAARRLTDELLTAALEIANRDFGLACRTLADLPNDVQRLVQAGQIGQGAANAIIPSITSAQTELGCACS